MKKRIVIFICILLLAYVSSSAFLVYRIHKTISPSLDIVDVNDLVQSMKNNWNNLEPLPADNYGLEYSVFDTNHSLIAKTSEWVSKNIHAAITHRDTIVDIYDGTVLLGKLVIYNDYDASLALHQKDLYVTCFIIISIFMLLCLLFVYYIYRSIYRPFKHLQGFARNVAAGNLDIPLEMDRQNIFGAFTESFDIMREELKSARAAEQQANKSKKELVAQLSHDIKTPVASIKAVSELLSAKAAGRNEIAEHDIRHLDTIGQKADQINTLITDMFNATLEELQELRVQPSEQSSQCLNEIVRMADYFHKIDPFEIAECLIYADLNRLTQVVDNIISNSYKYAGTQIKLQSLIEGKYLMLAFIDFGAGVETEALPLLFHKFYRAKNAEGKAGAGLGLYISRYLMNQMDGDITCENAPDGFQITLMIKLV